MNCHCSVKWPLKRKNIVCCRCRTEYDQRNVAVRGDTETQKKFHSFVLFLGELYLNLEVRGFYLINLFNFAEHSFDFLFTYHIIMSLCGPSSLALHLASQTVLTNLWPCCWSRMRAQVGFISHQQKNTTWPAFNLFTLSVSHLLLFVPICFCLFRLRVEKALQIEQVSSWLVWMTWWTVCSTILWMQISSVLSNCLRFQISIRYVCWFVLNAFQVVPLFRQVMRMCFEFTADRFCPGWRVERGWKTTHGTTDPKNRNCSTGCHLQQVCISILYAATGRGLCLR